MIDARGKLTDAISAFLKLKSVEGFYHSLTSAQQSDFTTHLRKYLNIYLPEAGFEICSTDRYPGPKAESCIIANRPWKVGEVIHHLSGTLVAMTEEEEDFYETGQDFSILHSSRLDAMCLFLGPARFINHDCDPNGEFRTDGKSIALKLIKPVGIGEEITVSYSSSYFGPGNTDCLCRTCEHNGKGAYDKSSEKRTTVQDRLSGKNPLFPISIRSSIGAGSHNRLETVEIPNLRNSDGTGKRKVVEVTVIDSDQDSVQLIEEDADYGVVESEEELEEEAPAVRGKLRPRHETNYNLKNSFEASLRPKEWSESRPTQRKPHRADTDYCAVCDDEMGLTSDRGPRTEALKRTSISLLCRRCERHAKLYEQPWPIRTRMKRVSSRSSNSSMGGLSSERMRTPRDIRTHEKFTTGCKRKRSNSLTELYTLSSSENSLSTGDHDIDPVTMIETAKAQLREGKISIRHRESKHISASRNHGKSTSSLASFDSGQTPGSGPSEMFRRRHMHSSAGSNSKPTMQACLLCKEKGVQCTRVENGRRPCKSCLLSEEICLNQADLRIGHEDKIPPARGAASAEHERSANGELSAKSVSTPSRNTEYVVKPSRTLSAPVSNTRKQDELYDFDQGHSQVAATKNPRRSLGALEHVEPKKSKSWGVEGKNWCYVEVSEEEEPALILPQGRTRGQARNAKHNQPNVSSKSIYQISDSSEDESDD